MSIESGQSAGMQRWFDISDPRGIRIFRFAIGVTLSVAAAFAIAWPLYFVTPIFVAKFLGTAAPRLSLRAGLMIIAIIGLGCLLGLTVSTLTIHYPVLCLLLVTLVLFHIFYANVRGTSPLMIAFMLIGVTVIPLMSLESMNLALGIAFGLLMSGGLAIVFVWVAHGLMPDRHTQAQPTPVPVKPTMTPREQIRSAAISTIVVLPVVVLFFTTKMTENLLVLVFIAMLAQQPDVNTGKKGGMALIIGNTVGGIAAIIFYNLLIAVPEYPFLIMLTLLATLFFGARIFSDKPSAGLYAAALSTLILLVGSTTGDLGGDAESKFYIRIIQIICAASYIVGAFILLDLLSRRRQRKADTEHGQMIESMDAG